MDTTDDRHAAARQRFADMDTGVLLHAWRTTERQDWADAALRDELISRGKTQEYLDVLVRHRQVIEQNRPRTFLQSLRANPGRKRIIVTSCFLLFVILAGQVGFMAAFVVSLAVGGGGWWLLKEPQQPD